MVRFGVHGFSASMGTQAPHAGPCNSLCVQSLTLYIILQKGVFVILIVHKFWCWTALHTHWLIGPWDTLSRTLGTHTSRLDPTPHAGSVLSAPSRAFGQCHYVCVEYLTCLMPMCILFCFHMSSGVSTQTPHVGPHSGLGNWQFHVTILIIQFCISIGAATFPAP